MKKTISLVVAVILLVCVCPMNALADSGYVIVSNDYASVHDTYYDTGDVLKWFGRGTMLHYVDTKTNMYFNKWYKVEFDEGYTCRIGWIWSGDVDEHQHNFDTFYYDGNTFSVCRECRYVKMERITSVSVQKANSLAAAIPVAGGLAAADGPLPVGEIAGLVVLGLAYIFYTGDTLTTSQINELIRETNLDEVMEATNKCGTDSFFKVSRANGTLTKIDNKCMGFPEAFICVRFLGFDVWTMIQENAEALAMINMGRYYGPERDKDKPEYWYHYHLGTNYENRDTDTHIFFGTNGYFQVPQ